MRQQVEYDYRVTDDLPPQILAELRRRFGARPGDMLTIAPGLERGSVSVYREFDRPDLAYLLDALNHLLPLPRPGLPPLRRSDLARAVGDDSSGFSVHRHLRVLE